MEQAFIFNDAQLNRLFPFFILLNEELEIISAGQSFKKFCPVRMGDRISEHFSIKRPNSNSFTFDLLRDMQHQLVILENVSDTTKLLRGQIEYLSDKNELLFIGSPWFSSIEQANSNNLKLTDFAFHDPLVDLLHVLKAQEIATDDLKHLVEATTQQRKELKKAIKESQDFATLPMQNPDPIIRISVDGDVLLNNPAAALLDFFVFNNKTYRNDTFFKLIADTIDTSQSRCEIEVESEDRIYSFLCIPVMKEGYINIYGKDITNEKKISNELKRLSLVASANKNGVLFTDVYGNITWANDGFCTLTGYSFEEIIGKSPVELCMGPLTDKVTLNSILDSFFVGNGFTTEIIYYKKDGSWFWGHSFSQPIKNDKGVITEFFGIIQDISAEKAIREKMKVLSQIAEDNINAVIIGNKEGEITWVNKSFTEITGYKLDEVIGKKPGQFLQGPDSGAKTNQYFSNQLRNGAAFNAEIINFHKNGTKYWVRIQGQPIRDENGAISGFFALEEDITREKESVDRFRKALESIGDNVWEHDFRNEKTLFSKTENDFLGYSIDELTDNKELWWNNVYPEDRHLLTLADLKYRNGKAESHSLEYRMVHKDGSIKWVLDRGVVVERDSRGKPLRITGTHTDITERKQMEQDLIKAREKAELLAKTKETFLANMSHEIRTPMNAIIGMGNLLHKTELNTQQHFYLNTIRTAADNLLVIINDILDLSKIEAGKLTVEKIGFVPRKIIKDAMQVLVHKAEEKGLILSSSFCDPRLSEILIGDPYRLNQVLLNLMSNAVKFTEKGSVDIKCEVILDTNLTQTVRATITDTGIGMDSEFVEKLFDKFSQEYESISRKFGGTGLGMSICKELVSLMGGKIEVHSEKGKGTSVQFEIEFKKGNKEDLPVVSTLAVTQDFLSDKVILIADDNLMNRLVASSILKNYGASILEATNGEEAFQLVRSHKPDLVLMDIQMPVLNGYDATRKLRKSGSSIPVIALTANAIKGENDKCTAAGMNDYIAKPFKEDLFLKIIAQWLQTDVQLVEEKKVDAGISVSDKSYYSLSGLEKVGQGNRDFISKMLLVFIEQVPTTLKDIKIAYQQEDMVTVKKLTHRIKPSIDYLCIDAITAEIREIEANAEVYGVSPNMDYLINKVDGIITEVVIQLREYLEQSPC